MKDKILELLKNSSDFVSGEEISSLFGVSRTAIWKNINSLKEDGYIIESSSKKGYKLIKSPDILTSGEVMPLLNTEYIGKEIQYHDSIDSTNNKGRMMASEGCAEGLVITAEEQTAGRGRLGRQWTTPKFTSIAFSLVLKPRIKPAQAPGITIVMGTAVCSALKKLTSLDVGIKWPNDIIINNKKVCGILTEMNAEIDAVNFIVAGVGINVNINKFPDELSEIATSLMLETGREVSRKEVLAAVLTEFEMLYNEFKQNGLKDIIEQFKNYSVTLGRQVKVISINETFEGEAVDITSDGILIVKTSDGTMKKVVSGDVSVRGISSYV